MKDIPTAIQFKKYLELHPEFQGSEYMNLKEGDLLLEINGNGHWGTNKKGCLSFVKKVIYPGVYIIKRKGTKNIGTKEEQKWVLDSEYDEDERWNFERVAVVWNNSGKIHLNWIISIEENGDFKKYENGYEILDETIEEFLKTKKVDYDFNPY